MTFKERKINNLHKGVFRFNVCSYGDDAIELFEIDSETFRRSNHLNSNVRSVPNDIGN